jgi:hypothetical protein
MLLPSIGEAVDDRNRRPPGQHVATLLGEGADHDAVAVAAEHAGGVLDGLAAGDLRALRGEVHGVAAELDHPDLERHPRAGRRLFEHHAEGAALEGAHRLAALAQRLELRRPRQ